MAIHVVTGTPGAGKTLYVVALLIRELYGQGRVIYHDIDGLDVAAIAALAGVKGPHVEGRIRPLGVSGEVGKITPRTWSDADDGAIFIFDEAQRDYRARNPSSAVPAWVAPLETHRHRGFDFIFITQHPQMLDSHVQNLCTRHTDLYRPFNFSRTTVAEWQIINKNPRPPQTRADSDKRAFVFPREMFSAYKSATVHTMQRKIPWKTVGVIGLIAVGAVVGVINLVSWVYGYVIEPQEAVEQLTARNGATSPPERSCYDLVALGPERVAYRVSRGSPLIWVELGDHFQDANNMRREGVCFWTTPEPSQDGRGEVYGITN